MGTIKSMDPNEVIDEFTGGAPRASEWRAMRQALSDRLRALRHRREAEPETAAQTALDREIATLARQVQTLETEEVVARFVEDSIAASLARAPGDLDRIAVNGNFFVPRIALTGVAPITLETAGESNFRKGVPR